MNNQGEAYYASDNSTEEFSNNLNIGSKYQYQTISNEFPNDRINTESTYSTIRYKNCTSIIILLAIGYHYLIKQISKDIPKSMAISFILISSKTLISLFITLQLL